MYKNKIVCALKHNNSTFVENKDTVFLPFNSDYSIYLKNMSDATAFITIHVNGRNISPGKKIRLCSKCYGTVSKFQDTNHIFSFKEKTKELQEVRPSQDEDGLIRIKVEFLALSALNTKEHPKTRANSIAKKSSNFNRVDSLDDLLYKGLDRSLYKDNIIDNQTFTNSIDASPGLGNDQELFAKSIDASFGAGIRSVSLDTADTTAIKSNFETQASQRSAGFTAPSKKSLEKDDLRFVERTSSFGVAEEFEFIINLEESIENTVYNKEIKKICPTCKLKFKNKYFYCPFDGTFLEQNNKKNKEKQNEKK